MRFRRPHLLASASSVSPRTRARPSNSHDTQLASAVAGVASRLLLHPVDCVKTRLQNLRARPDEQTAVQAVVSFVAAEGVPGLYRGILGALAGVLPYSMLYMPSYELAQARLGAQLGSKELLGLRHVVAGSVAGLCGSLVKVPVDVVKKRLQAGLYPNLGVALCSIAREGGGVPLARVLRFYAGWRSSIMYDIPYNAVQFTVLENVKRTVSGLGGRGRGREMRGVDNVLVGALTGMITSVLTEPLDVVKTRLMTQRVGAQAHGVTVYRGWLHCMRTIVREEGPAGLWKGTVPRLVWVGASSAIWYGTYQAAREAMKARRASEGGAERELQDECEGDEGSGGQ